MPATQPRRILSVRLPEVLLRRVKSRAAAEGQTLQQAVQSAVEAWVGQRDRKQESPRDWLADLERFRGSLAGSGDFKRDRHQDKHQEWKQDRRAGHAGSAR